MNASFEPLDPELYAGMMNPSDSDWGYGEPEIPMQDELQEIYRIAVDNRAYSLIQIGELYSQVQQLKAENAKLKQRLDNLTASRVPTPDADRAIKFLEIELDSDLNPKNEWHIRDKMPIHPTYEYCQVVPFATNVITGEDLYNSLVWQDESGKHHWNPRDTDYDYTRLPF